MDSITDVMTTKKRYEHFCGKKELGGPSAKKETNTCDGDSNSIKI